MAGGEPSCGSRPISPSSKPPPKGGGFLLAIVISLAPYHEVPDVLLGDQMGDPFPNRSSEPVEEGLRQDPSLSVHTQDAAGASPSMASAGRWEHSQKSSTSRPSRNAWICSFNAISP